MILHPACGARRAFRHASRTALWLALTALVSLAGCAPHSAIAPAISGDERISPDALMVPANVPWVDTGIDVVAGRPISIVGKGRAAIGKLMRVKEDPGYE